MRIQTLLITASAICAFVQFAVAQEADKPTKQKNDGPEETLIEITPAAIPRAALANPLLPPRLETVRGNAATLYLRATTMAGDLKKQLNEFSDKRKEYLETPIDEFPVEDARKVVGPFVNIFKELRLAARRRRCDFQLPIEESGTQLYYVLMPELQLLRDLSRVFSVHIRVLIREGKFDEAIDCLQTGYAMGRHVGDAPFLVNSLVGVAICQMMNERVVDFAQQEGTPNLYWSLTALPRPLVSMRRALELESASSLLVFPELLTAAKATSLSESAKQLEAFLSRFDKLAGDSTNVEGPEYQLRKRLSEAVRDPETQKKIRSFLKEDANYSAEQVDQMNFIQVVMVRERILYERLRDSLFIQSFLPYHQARAGFKVWNDAYEQAKKDGEVVPLVALLLPGIDRACEVQARLVRDVHALRFIEALRQYALYHNGKLPQDRFSLSLATSDNPIDGKSFEYKLDGDEATLRTDDGASSSVRYRIRIRN